MKPYALAIILCLTLTLTVSAQPRQPLPVDVEALHVRLDSVHRVPANEPGRAIKGCRGDYHH